VFGGQSIRDMIYGPYSSRDNLQMTPMEGDNPHSTIHGARNLLNKSMAIKMKQKLGLYLHLSKYILLL
jgi:hypothetical protein